MRAKSTSGLRAMMAAVATMATLGAALGGCWPCDSTLGGYTVAVANWHFESDCGSDAMCGFTTTAGNATRVTAFTPGEHALRLEAGTELDHALSASVPFGPEYVEMVARCDEGAHLEADELVVDSTAIAGTGDAGARDAGDAGAGTPPRLRAGTVTLSPGAGWARVRASFPNGTDADGGADAGPVFGQNAQNVTATDLRLRAVGGACVIDEVQYGYVQPAVCAE